MAINVTTEVWRQALPAGEKLVALALADHARQDGSEARPSLSLIEQKTGLHRSTIIRHLQGLVAKGVIMIQRKPTSTTPTVYRFNMDRLTGSQNTTGSQIGVAKTASGGRKMLPKPLEPSFISVSKYERPTGMAEWLEVKAHMKKIGANGDPDLSDPVVALVVERIGWKQIFAMPAWERQTRVRDLITEVLLEHGQ